MNKKELAKRYLLFIISLFFSALGVAFTKHGGLGVSPISSVANVLSCRFDFLSIGIWLIIWNCLLILGQIVILRRKFQIIQLLQIPLSVLFGVFTDIGMKIVSWIPTDSYIMKLSMVVTGIIILAFGVSLSVIANVILNSGEAFVKAISDTTHKQFGNVKIAFDVGCVAASVILSLIFFDFKIVGAREGTVISAFTVGLVVKFFNKHLQQPISSLLTTQSTEAELPASNLNRSNAR